MMKNLKFLISYLLVALTFTSPQLVEGMEEPKLVEDMEELKLKGYDENTFSARKSMLKECINQRDNLLSGLTFGKLHEACEALYPLYKSRLEFNSRNNLDEQTCGEIYSWIMEMKEQGWTNRWLADFGPSTDVFGRLEIDKLNSIESFVSLIKVDILDSHIIQQHLYGPLFRINGIG